MIEFSNSKALETKSNELLTGISDENYFDKNNRNLFSCITVGTQSADVQ